MNLKYCKTTPAKYVVPRKRDVGLNIGIYMIKINIKRHSLLRSAGLNIDEFDATKDTILLFLIRGAWVLIMDQYNLPDGI